MGCGSQNTTSTSTSSPPPQVLADYQNLVNQGQAVSQLPLQQYQGPVIAGFNPTQQAAFSEVDQAQGSALPYINAAQSYLAAGAQPVMNQVQGFNSLGEYENPYTQQVTQATENLLNNQNAQQFNQANASAASAGAFGGDRESVLEAQMAQQQQLAEAPTLANIQSQGFTGAEQELNAQQNLQLQGGEGSAWLAENAAGEEAGLGNQAQNSLLSGASAQLQTGALEQQLQQEELQVPEAQFEQQQQFPYQTTNYLAGIIEGAAPGEGGTTTTTTPGPNLIGQLMGLGAAGLGAANSSGLFSSGSAVDDPYASAASALGMSDANLLNFGYEPLRRGGRIRVPVLRDIGGTVPSFPSASTSLGGFDAGDMADIAAAVQLAGAPPVTMPPAPAAHASPFPAGANVTMQGGQSSGSSSSGSSGASSAISGLASMAPMIAMMFMKRGGRAGFPGFSAGGGFPRAFANSGGVPPVVEAMPDDPPPLDPSATGDASDTVDVATGPGPGRYAFPSVRQDTSASDSAGVPAAAASGMQGAPSAFPSATRQTASNGSPSTTPSGGARWVPPPAPDSGARPGGIARWLGNPLTQIGIGMMASRSPFVLSQLGEGLGYASREQQAQIKGQRANAPHVVSTGRTMKIVYPDGRIVDTGIGAG
jgi:hypothetical protein